MLYRKDKNMISYTANLLGLSLQLLLARSDSA